MTVYTIVEAEVALTSQTANGSPVTWFTPITDGLYKISAYIVVSHAGTDVRGMACFINYSDGVALQTNQVTAVGSYTSNITLGRNSTEGSSNNDAASTVFISSSQAVTYEVDFSGPNSTGFLYDIYLSAERISS